MKKLLVMMTVMLCAMVACNESDYSSTEQYGRKPDAYVPPPADAPAPGTAGWASCYTSGNPDAACNLSVQFCCFNEIDAPNNGWCVNNSDPPQTTCTRSWNFCDGAEDCAAGSRCNVHIMPAPLYEGNIFSITCASTWDAGDHQICHGPSDTSCPTGTTCTLGESSTVGYYGMPPNMYVCW